MITPQAPNARLYVASVMLGLTVAGTKEHGISQLITAYSRHTTPAPSPSRTSQKVIILKSRPQGSNKGKSWVSQTRRCYCASPYWSTKRRRFGTIASSRTVPVPYPGIARHIHPSPASAAPGAQAVAEPHPFSPSRCQRVKATTILRVPV